MMQNKRLMQILAACGTACAVSGAANGQAVVNVSGATLLESFLISRAFTNDFINVDATLGNGDSLSGNGVLQQLAPGGLPPVPPAGFTGDQVLMINYRAIGSVNGLQELIDFGQAYVTTVDGVDIDSATTSDAYLDRILYVSGGAAQTTDFNSGNPGGSPIRSTTPGGFLSTPTATFSSPPTPSAGGLRIDIAPVDVPGKWATFRPGGTPAFDLTPGTPGYGLNPTVTVDKDGRINGFNHLLADLGTLNLFDPAVTPDNNTVFDTLLTYAPVGAVVNYGLGWSQIDKSDLRHLMTTGRNKCGENAMVATRDSGSGTRNAFSNGICIDPSWCIGENIGDQSTAREEERAGPFFQPSNKGGSSRLEATMRATRLGIGHTGAERGLTRFLQSGELDYLAVRNDLPGENGVTYNRPNATNVITYTFEDGYTIGGPSTLITIGDPQNENAIGGTIGNTNPPMLNTWAAGVVNNVSASIASIASNPTGNQNDFSPGEFLAFNFIPLAALDNIQVRNGGLQPDEPCAFVPNPNQNPVLRSFVLSNSRLAAAEYQAFGVNGLNGIAPTRETAMGGPYTDEILPAVTNAGNYATQGTNGSNGVAILYGDDVLDRNRIAGDFNGDGERDLNDADEMLLAWADRNVSPRTAWLAPNGTGAIAGAPGADACIEILGDFNSDGNFDGIDVRYWADGLAMDKNTGKLDRCAGYMAVDNAFGGNFFGTTLANMSASYDNGDSVADIAGAPVEDPAGSGDFRYLTTPGFVPAGHDGVVDNHDIDYVCRQFAQNPRVTDGELNWDNTFEAIGGDLSADINGDLVINIADVEKIVEDILETSFGDVNLDGTCDMSDLMTAQANLGNPGGWADGDMDCDGQITQADIDIINACINAPVACFGDADGNNAVDVNDITFVVNRLGTMPGTCLDGDVDGNGVVDVNDITTVVNNLGQCNAGPC